MLNGKSSILFYAAALGLLLAVSGCTAPKVTSSAQPISHAAWDSLLRKHVDDHGLVDYQGFAQDSNQLKDYLSLLSNNAPNEKTWSKTEQLAYWINAYNAFTVKLILDYYPVNSIKDIKDGIPFVNTVWDVKFFTIAGKEFDLNNIEHGILRKEFDDPRIHFSLVCASMSCPKLQNFAFTGDKLDTQLDEAASEFLNEPFRNEIGGETIRLSKLLDWYWGDFKDKYQDRYELINRYAKKQVKTSQPIEFIDYDWRLNEQTPEKEALVKG
ncbi:MAG: DUF547 domain-containing protein [Bacteroidetes bacterium]|nr:MAG: DUF547 domain-containing protein [Bacteroidota bacterium]PTM14880.1 MAG: DUF547 domain-containing protein [Bacteroidota bacterium]